MGSPCAADSKIDGVNWLPAQNGGEDGIRTHETLLRSAPLAGACLRPLGHLSVRAWIPGMVGYGKRFLPPNAPCPQAVAQGGFLRGRRAVCQPRDACAQAGKEPSATGSVAACSPATPPKVRANSAHLARWESKAPAWGRTAARGWPSVPCRGHSVWNRCAPISAG